MKKVIKIAIDGTLSLIDIADMNQSVPYARRLNSKFFYVWDDGFEGSDIVNKIATKVTSETQSGDIFIVKSDYDVTGFLDKDDCKSCSEYDLQLFERLKDNLYDFDF